ncbi:MAG: hypothetical protein AAF611_17415 [Bacteroidota bacterium]
MDKDDLKLLRDTILIDFDIIKLINEKEKAIDTLTHKQTSGYFEPKPSLTPKDDLNLPKEKSLSKELKDAQRNKIEQTRKDFDDKIEDKAIKSVIKNGNEEQLDMMTDLGRDNLITLLDNNGVNKVYELLQEKAIDLDKTETEQKHIEEPSTLEKIQLDEYEMDHLMQNKYFQNFEENAKDIDLGKDQELDLPEPSGDYE